MPFFAALRNALGFNNDERSVGIRNASATPDPRHASEDIARRRGQSGEERWRVEREIYEQRLSTLEREVEYRKHEFRRMQKERDDTKAAWTQAQHNYSKLTLDYNDLGREVQQLWSERERATASYNQLLQEHDQVAAQLRSAKALMGTNDEVSTEEIVQSVKDINAIISQVANTLSDGVQERLENPDSAKDSAGVSRASAQLRSFLSDSFISQLCARDHIEDNILVQYGVQACLVYHICGGIRQFHINLGSGPNALLIKLFGKVQASASQAIAAHWRSLTHLACQDLAGGSSSSDLKDNIIVDINAIFELARCTTVNSVWEQRVASLLDTAARLSLIIQQKAYSKSYFATFLAPGHCFDPEQMQDVLKSQPHRLNSPVCCTVALGLAYTIHPKDEPIQRVQILLSEVVQQQTLEDLLDD